MKVKARLRSAALVGASVLTCVAGPLAMPAQAQFIHGSWTGTSSAVCDSTFTTCAYGAASTSCTVTYATGSNGCSVTLTSAVSLGIVGCSDVAGFGTVLINDSVGADPKQVRVTLNQSADGWVYVTSVPREEIVLSARLNAGPCGTYPTGAWTGDYAFACCDPN